MISFVGVCRLVKHYFVDLENVHSRWTSVLSEAKFGDEFILFYSEAFLSLSIPVKSFLGDICQGGVSIRFMKCECGLHNAMDFQIVAEIGRLSVQCPDDEFIIVSGDTGFQSIVNFMKERGVVVSVTGPVAECITLREQYLQKLVGLGLGQVSRDAIVDVFLVSMSLPSNKRKLDCRNRIRALYGAADGEKLYCKIKPVVDDIVKHGPFPEPCKEKLVLSNDIVFSILQKAKCKADKAHVKKVMDAVVHARKMKNAKQSLEARLSNVFGDKPGKAVFREISKFL